MIASLQGIIHETQPPKLVVATASGVGYEVTVTRLQAAAYHVGQEIFLYTYLKVSDQALDLYGFATTADRDFFMLLLTVSGVGPKSAMTILSLGSVEDIRAAIARGDVKYLTAVSGMGKKTAERLVVELKSKLGAAEGTRNQEQGMSDELADVVAGLIAMGYSGEEARDAVQACTQADREGKSPEALLREALRKLGR